MTISNFISDHLTKVFVVSVVFTLLWYFAMSSIVKPLTSNQIVAFELAKTPEVAVNIVSEWEKKDLIMNAKKSIYLDFVFLVLYSFSIAFGCLVLSNFTGNRFLIQLGLWLSKLVFVAGFFDMIENLAMLKTLSGMMTAQTTTVAYWFAIIKFSIVIVSLLFAIGCLIFGGLKKVLAK